MKKICFACASVKGSSKYPEIHGKVTFRQLSSGVIVYAKIFGLPETNDIFAFHIHQGEQCSGNSDDPFADADGHFNPGEASHPYHSGDLPPLFGNHGYACMSFFTDRFSVSEIIGKTIIIHRHADDFTTQPSGNSGDKIACGKIEARC